MEKSVILLLVVVLACVLIKVDASCIDRDVKDHNSTESTVDKVSNFFMEVGCTLKSGAEKVKEKVESGYNYLKSKIDDSTHKNKTITENKTEINEHDSKAEPKEIDESKVATEELPLMDDGRITFKDEDSEISPIDIKTTELPKTTTSSNNNSTVELDNRTAIDTPSICPQGQERINGQCRKTFNDF